MEGLPSTVQVHEHEPIILPEGEEIKSDLCLNRDANRYFIQYNNDEKEQDEKEEDEKEQDEKKKQYKASYVIGVQWIETKTGRIPLVVLPKINDIDFLGMFMRCFMNPDEYASFHDIYGIDTNAEPITCDALESVLSPLLIVHYVSMVKRFLRKDLKKNYVNRCDNLNKIRGRISIAANLKTNTLRGRLHKIYCNYQEFTQDIVENRIIKKALLFSKSIVQRMKSTVSVELVSTINSCLSRMDGVSDEVSVYEVKFVKFNSIYKEYKEIVSMACAILKRYDYNLNKTSAQPTKTPPFWIDMPLLFEHYVGGLLAESYPGDIVYQASGKMGKPDFLSIKAKAILDAKYMLQLKYNNYFTEEIRGIVRQLAGYSRDRNILDKLYPGYDSVVPCVFIYPLEDGLETFSNPRLESYFNNKMDGLTHFYKIGVRLPTIKA